MLKLVIGRRRRISLFVFGVIGSLMMILNMCLRNLIVVRRCLIRLVLLVVFRVIVGVVILLCSVRFRLRFRLLLRMIIMLKRLRVLCVRSGVVVMSLWT